MLTILWDNDGVLVDTEGLYFQASRDVLRSVGVWLIVAPVKFDPSQLVLYTTAEPCPMCQGAISWSGIGTVVSGTSIRFLQSLGWRQIDILAEEVVRVAASRRLPLLTRGHSKRRSPGIWTITTWRWP